MKFLIRTALGILFLVVLVHFVPGFATLLFSIVLLVCVWPMALLSLYLMYRAWKVGKKVGLAGTLRVEFALKRAFRDIFTKTYRKFVSGDHALLNKTEQARLMKIDGIPQSVAPQQPAKKTAAPKATAPRSASRSTQPTAPQQPAAPATPPQRVSRPFDPSTIKIDRL